MARSILLHSSAVTSFDFELSIRCLFSKRHFCRPRDRMARSGHSRPKWARLVISARRLRVAWLLARHRRLPPGRAPGLCLGQLTVEDVRSATVEDGRSGFVRARCFRERQPSDEAVEGRSPRVLALCATCAISFIQHSRERTSDHGIPPAMHRGFDYASLPILRAKCRTADDASCCGELQQSIPRDATVDSVVILWFRADRGIVQLCAPLWH